MKANYTHVSILLYRSGSMEENKSFIIEGFNDFIKSQKKEPGELSVTLVQFDTEYEVLYDFKSINDIPRLNGRIYLPRGMTALNDCWVKLIEDTGIKLSGLREQDRPEKVLLISFSDGKENSSKKYGTPEGDEFIKDLVAHQDKVYGWKFLYIGANQDSKSEGVNRGISNYMNFKATGKGVSQAFYELSLETGSFRESKTNSFNVKRDL